MCFQNHSATDKTLKQLSPSPGLQFSPSFSEEYKVECSNPTQTSSSDEMTFYFTGEDNFENVYIEDSAMVSSCDFSNNEATVCLSVDDSVSTVSILFEFGNQKETRYRLYFAHNSITGNHYSSNLSLDYAKRSANIQLDYDYQDNVASSNVTSNAYSSLTSPGQQTKNIIQGSLKWTDDQNHVHPLYGATIVITRTENNLQIPCLSTVTNENGEYYLGIPIPSYTNNVWNIILTFNLYLEGESVKVAPQNGATYHKSFLLIPNSEGVVEYSATFDYSNDFGKAAHVFQAGVYYSLEAKKLNNGEPIKKCTFRYPFTSKERNSYYCDSTVHIDSSRDGPTSSLNAYAAWDVIGHEYGHHVQEYFDITNTPGGNHFYGQSDIDSQYLMLDKNNERIYSLAESKERGIALAWGEAWATYWAEIAQGHFPEHIKNIDTVCNAVYEAPNGNFYLDVKDYGHERIIACGEAGEADIIRVLYKLSSPETDSYDKFSISEDIILSLVIENHIKYFHDFINCLYDAGYNKYDIGKLLSAFKITTNTLYICYDRPLDCSPTFKWSNDSGSQYLPYNDIALAFYDKYNKLVLTIGGIQTNQYTLTSSEWATIVRKCSDYYYVSVVSHENSFCESGSYYSELFRFSLPYYYANTSYLKPSDWGFEPQYFFTTNKWKQTSTPVQRGALTITHDRLRCGYIENSYIVLSPKRENAGLAYLTLNFDKPVYSYAFGVAVWSTLVSEGLSPSTCTAKIEALDANGVWREELDLLNDVTLSSRTQQIDKYCTFCSDGIYGLRFIVTAPAVGNNNRGRICIDKILLNTNPDDPYFIDYLYC